ncbi:DNA mismatch repair protein MutS [Desulfogranum japonicum]|uniref:DNA mismatch repair protein MutS n=1 Tax=Desulfogranum japonicum TaxID=231447 RepID=UPI000405402F|nr:DNA mismatch repair protein MutS [Desulfogranum japonicum]
MTKSPKITPMLQQYLELKEQHKDAILFYRMGDFYEMFFEDAEIASKALGITLTSRNNKGDANKVPMCGVPFHALGTYLGKMVKAGHRVAICEQVQDPKEAKGIVQREVVRIVSPGVTTDDQLLDEKTNCYICSLTCCKKYGKGILLGLSFLDASTGIFLLTEFLDALEVYGELVDIITRFQPAELLISETTAQDYPDVISTLQTVLPGLCLTTRADHIYDLEQARTTLTEHFQTANLGGFGCDQLSCGIRSAGALLAYIQDTQKASLNHIQTLRTINKDDHLIIDEASRRNLELTETLIGGVRSGTLLDVLDCTTTPMGARLLKERIISPLNDETRITRRLDAVEELCSNPQARKQIRDLLAKVYDLERLCSRLVLGQGNARDIAALKTSFQQLPSLAQVLDDFTTVLFADISQHLDPLKELCTLIEVSIRDDAPPSLREGKLICEGYHERLDHLIHLLRDGKQLILDLEGKERQKTGIAKLKVGFNKVFGYYFEVSRAQASLVPEDYIRKQTLVNAERFITPELKELENEISSAQEERLDLEYRLFTEIRDRIAAESNRILQTAHQIARIDFLTSLAEASAKYRYCKPTLNFTNEIQIQEGRHPVIERSLDSGRFVANDVFLDQECNQLLIITGPNMAGKSTVLRQTALIVLMAHLGCFVPADSASICLTDRIFTRVGAMDDLRRGQSTFMVEMNETANILNNATENSLVILDEIGRGTSTYDGLAIAWAVAEELVNKNDIGIKTLFATHYHELTDLAISNTRVQNYSIAVKEWNDKILFLHKLVKGATNRSYGIQVAALAGVPGHVIQRAHAILASIEQGEFDHHGKPHQTVKDASGKHQPCQLQLFTSQTDALRDLLKENKPDELSPRQALNLVYELHALMKK